MQKVLSPATKDSIHWMSGPSSRRALLEVFAASRSRSRSKEPTWGISRSIRNRFMNLLVLIVALQHVSGAFAQLDLYIQAAASAEDGHVERITGVFLAQRACDGVDFSDLFTVDRGNEVASDAYFLVADHDQ